MDYEALKLKKKEVNEQINIKRDAIVHEAPGRYLCNKLSLQRRRLSFSEIEVRGIFRGVFEERNTRYMFLEAERKRIWIIIKGLYI